LKTTALALAVLALFGAFAAYMVREAHAGADPNAMDAMSIDLNTTGNSATALGARQSCQRINENNTLDADETSTDTLTFDVTATNIPVTNRMIGFSYQLSYEESALTIQSGDDGFLLEATPGSSLFGGNDLTPDTNNDDSFTGSALDTSDYSSVLPEAGSGVLQRHTISSDSGAVAGQYPIALDPPSAAVHINSIPTAFAANSVNNGTIAIDQVCGGSPSTPTPSPTVAPSPTASPTAAPTASPSPTPVPTGSPTASATASPISSPTATPTSQPTVAPTGTPGGPTPTPTQTPGPTDTPSPTGTGSSPTPTPTPTPEPTPLPTGVTPAPTGTATPVPTPLPSGVTPAPTPTATPAPSSTPTASDTPGPSDSPVGKPKGSVDCDQDVDSIDALHVLRFVGALGQAACIAEADVDCDGDRDVADALKILRFVAGLNVVLPDGCAPIGTMVT
jgi:hypothetical protein